MFLFFLLASGILEVLSYWHPHQHTSWNDVIGETHINTGIHGDVYVIDLFEHHGLIPELIRYLILHKINIVSCQISWIPHCSQNWRWKKIHESLCIFPSSYKPFSVVNHRMMRCSLWEGYQIIVAQAWCKLTNHALVMSRLLIYYVMLDISNILKLRFWNIETMFQIIQDISSKIQ